MEQTIEVPGLATRIRLYRGPAGKGGAQLLGFAELVIAGAFVIKDIRILKVLSKEKDGSVFVSFPSRLQPGGEKRYYDVAHPITAEAYQEAKDAILSAYEEEEAKTAHMQ
ncbi:MAG: septation protein SpoVG family protein [Elusimicrobia bacterium]|nr:septation protein SpoVG family protein [Elusimicrobiota bacterium]